MRRAPAGVAVLTVDTGARTARPDRLARSCRCRSSRRSSASRSAGDAAMHELLREAGGFAASLLAGGQEWLAQHFARGVPPIGMWHGVETEEASGGREQGRRCSQARSAGSSAGSPPSTRPATTRSSSARSSPSSLGAGGAAARLPRRGVPDAVIEAVVFDLDGVILQTEEVWDEVREQLRRRARRALRRGGAAGDDGDELAGVVAVPARGTRRSGDARGDQRRRRAPDGGALPRGAAADPRRRARRSSGSRRAGRSGWLRRRTGR